MSKVCWCLAVLGISASSVVQAGDVTPGFEVSLRLGYGNPMGAVEGGPSSDLSALFSGQVPLQVDLAYRVTPELSLALYGQYAFASIATSACARAGIGCSGSDVRTGIEVFWRFLPGLAVDPWVGAGIGYEWATATVETQAVATDVTFRGLEVCNAQVGADYVATPRFSVGPFAQLTFGRYSTVSASRTGTRAAADLLDARTHEWLQLGVRGAFSL